MKDALAERDALAEERGAEAAALRDRLAALEAGSEELWGKLAAADEAAAGEARALRAEAAELQAALAAAQAARDAAAADRDAVARERDAACASLATAQADFAGLEAQLQGVDGARVAAVRDARQQAAAAADLEKSLAQTTDAAAKAKAAAALQSEEVRNVRAQLEKALTDLEVARRDKEALEELRRNSINEEVARNQASQKRLDELATEKRELLAQLRAAQQSEANAKGALGKAQIELDLAGKTAEETRQKVADLEARVEAEVGKRAASESTQSELLSKAKRLESENEMQQSQLEEKDRKIETLEVQVQARNATKEMANVRKSATRPGSGNGRK